jgi:hypothetical protein
MTKQYRQGDVFFQEIDKLPDGVEVTNNPILAYGEVTGHSHRVCNADACQMFVDKSGNVYIVSTGEVNIGHEEHGPVTLPPGIHVVTRQREYDPIEAARERRVAD